MFDKEKLEQLKQQHKAWSENHLAGYMARFPERRSEFITTSSEPVERLYTPLDIAELDYAQDLGNPGEFRDRFGVPGHRQFSGGFQPDEFACRAVAHCAQDFPLLTRLQVASGDDPVDGRKLPGDALAVQFTDNSLDVLRSFGPKAPGQGVGQRSEVFIMKGFLIPRSAQEQFPLPPLRTSHGRGGSLPDALLQDLELAGFAFRVLETPGHSNDSVCYLHDRFLFTGDTLAAGTIGDTDTGFERALLLTSIRKKLLSLEPNVFVFPGHGPPTRLEIERRTNPLLTENV